MLPQLQIAVQLEQEDVVFHHFVVRKQILSIAEQRLTPVHQLDCQSQGWRQSNQFYHQLNAVTPLLHSLHPPTLRQPLPHLHDHILHFSSPHQIHPFQHLPHPLHPGPHHLPHAPLPQHLSPDPGEILLSILEPHLLPNGLPSLRDEHINNVIGSEEAEVSRPQGREDHALDGLLVTDSKGFEIYNSGFNNAHHLHSLYQLSEFFFPLEKGTVVGIETEEFDVVVRESEEGRVVAMRSAK